MQPTFCLNTAAAGAACASDLYGMPSGLLCWIAARNRPALDGIESSCNPTDIAPALSPNSVICSGSPPKRSMLSRTQRIASCWSIRP